jgi:SAM-dependent methyltransferase
LGKAAREWEETVTAEHAQADRVRAGDPQADHWRGLAHRFEPPKREDAFQDETLKALLPFIRPTDTVLDVGAGAGRLAVPLAERCGHVTAVEPSEAMRERMAEQAAAWGVTALSIVPGQWEDATVEPADIVICAHVIYTVRDIVGFLRKLTDHARREVIVAVFEEPAMANYFQLWPETHGEKRISLPCLPELRAVLNEMDIEFTAQKLPEWESRPFKDLRNAVEESMARLFVGKSTAKAKTLTEAVERSLVESADGLRFNWAKPHQPWLVRWAP